jgi:hypothetical protein
MLLVRSYKKWIGGGGGWGGAKLRVSTPRYLYIAFSSLVKYPSIQGVKKNQVYRFFICSSSRMLRATDTW